MKYKIEITQEDIDRGMRGRSDFCPVALALRRKWPEAEMGCFACDLGNRLVLVPELVSKFVEDFDSGKPVKPFTFEIEL